MKMDIKWFLAAEFFSDLGTGVSLLAIPIYMLSSDGGSLLFSSTVIISNILLFAASLYLGTLIDRINHKIYLRSIQLLGALFVAIIFGVMFFLPQNQNGLLALVYFVGVLHYTAHYPARAAFIQNAFASSDYLKVNGFLEMIGQASQLVGGLVGAFIIDKVGVMPLFAFDIVTYLFSAMFYNSVQNYSVEVKTSNRRFHISEFLDDIKSTVDMLSQRKIQFLVIMTAFLPFLAVLMQGYLAPVHIVHTLKAGVDVNSISTLIFSFGAFFAGHGVHKYLKKSVHLEKYIIAGLALFVGALLFSYWQNDVVSFYIGFLMLGIANSALKILRSTYMMNHIENVYMGRVNSFFNSFGLLFRVFMIMGMSAFINTYGTFNSLLPLIVLLVVSGLVTSVVLFFPVGKSTPVR